MPEIGIGIGIETGIPIAIPILIRIKLNNPEPSTAQAKAGDQGTVAVLVLALEVVEQFAAGIDHTHQTPAGVMVVLVLGKMPGELFYTGGQQGDLHFGRAGIALSASVFGDDLLFLCCAHWHGIVSHVETSNKAPAASSVNRLRPHLR